MGLTSGWTSLSVALILAVLAFSLMQVQRQWLSSSKVHIIITGYVGSLLFTFILTAIGNLESLVFGKRFQSKLTEVLVALGLAMMSSALVHRVCVTVCFLFSMANLYFITSQAKVVYPIPSLTTTKKRK